MMESRETGQHHSRSHSCHCYYEAPISSARCATPHTTSRRRDGVALDGGDVGCERRWRAVDQDGNVLDVLVRSRRNALAAKQSAASRSKGWSIQGA